MDYQIALLFDQADAMQRLAELFIAEWTPWYGPDGKGNAEADLIGCMNRDQLPIAVVAVSKDGQILGTAALKLESLGSEHFDGPWLAAVVVDPDFRGHGIGTSLIQAVEEQARRLGFAKIYTSTDAASSIVEKRGWKCLNHTVQSLRGPISIYKLAFV
ncbi:GNAT family N-acetyltransferase [Leisingera sp.]|uniref:GNAT family N-acetyltransferase n=1 Tax=Leisingera sp. TaxID=1879318 RepID=UPI002B26A4E5|nr:GNAT family N-acetyltransferase [Leisingera sp.]